MPLTNFKNGISSFGIPVLGGSGIPFTGKYFFIDPLYGSDGNSGREPGKAFSTIYKAYSMMTDGANDVAYLISDGSSASSARLSKALAQSVDSTATTGVLTWAKDACHLIGITAPGVNSRARIAPPTGTYTMATFGSGNFIVASASGCLFQNLTAFQGFSTGGASQICWTESGGRNSYINCNMLGMGDAASAGSTTGRSLLVTGANGENMFYGCTIGLDTQARSTGASEVEFAGGSPRNEFNNCTIATFSTAGADFWLKVGANGLDRYALFDNCSFINPIASGAVTLTTGFSVNASPGGAILLQNCLTYGATAIDTAGKSFQNLAPATTAGTKVAAASA
jgi:hypothetical protein